MKPRWLAAIAACFVAAAGSALALASVTLDEALQQLRDADAPVAFTYARTLAPRGSVAIERLAASPARHAWQFQPPEDLVPLDASNEMWVGLRLRPEDARLQLRVRQASVDEVTLFEFADGKWVASSAGDRVPVSSWPVPGRFPRFELAPRPGESRQLYLRVRNDSPLPVPLELAKSSTAQSSMGRADLGLGIALGALGLLVVASLVQAAVYRDRTYFLYGAYTLLLGLALASLSGVTGEHLWGDAPRWADAAKTFFPLAAAGVSVWLVSALCRVRTRSSPIYRAALGVGAALVAAAMATMLPGAPVAALAALGMLASAGMVVGIGIWTWRHGDAMGGWVLAAHAPLIVTTALIVLRMFGIAPVAFRPNVLVAVSMGFILLLLLVALVVRSREYLAVQMREHGMSSIDPLSGLLAARVFQQRLRSAMHRWQRSRHDAVVLYVRVANHDWIRQAHGAEVADRSLIRAAMKLQRVLPEADCCGRVGDSTMALIFETVVHRAAVMERASRLVAHGLMPLPGLKPEVTLTFHVVACLLSENSRDAEALQQAADEALASMSVRTRRPIRFLDSGFQAADTETGAEPDARAASA